MYILLSLFFILICNKSLQLSSNLIYGIHSTFYSLLIALMISNLIINSWLIFWSNSYCVFYSLSYSTVFISLLLLCWFSTIIWIVDFLIESFITLTLIEQLSLIVGIKLLLFSEVMLFFTCFWCYLNFRFIGSIFYLFYFPLFTFYSFSIPFGNLLIPLFSSLPIQSSQILWLFSY